MRNITRLDYDRTHGWWVRLYRTDAAGDKNCMSQMFSDGVHGGKRKALRRAIAWRDEMLALLPAPKKDSGSARPPGYGYVRRAEIKRRVGYSLVYRAWMRGEGGRAAQTTYSVAVWGDDGAKLRAQRWLVRKRRELRAAT
jgi:hypothetical protein